MIIIATITALVGMPIPAASDLPPMPAPTAIVAPADPTSAFAQIRARQAARQERVGATAISTQRMARVQGEMLAAIETDKAGNKTAKIVHTDGTVELRQLRVLATARVKPPAAPAPSPVTARDAAAAAAGAAAGAAAAAAAIKKRGKK